MTDTHSQSFFGQSTGIILKSSSKSEPYIFIICIKRKPDGIWEKPSLGEGKTIRCTLEEIVMILNVLNQKALNWQTYHAYKENKVSISFGWENEEKKTLWINIEKYSKMINLAQAEILRLLLTHILEEKIEFATGPTSSKKQNDIPKEKQTSFNYITEDVNEPKDDLIVETKVITKSGNGSDIITISGSIKAETEKALLLLFKSGKEVWFPKSTIHSDYQPQIDAEQKFLIDEWILKRNKIKADT